MHKPHADILHSLLPLLPLLRLLRKAVCVAAAACLAVACDLPRTGSPAQSAQSTERAATASSQTSHVTVQRVVDGDTVWVYRDNPSHVLKIRLLGIDAPERCQDWGKQSRKALHSRLRGRTVELEQHGTDKYERILAVLYLDGEDINAWLVREGHAWAGRWKGSPQHYEREEWDAQQNRRGLWSQPDTPEYPRDFRRSGVQCH